MVRQACRFTPLFRDPPGRSFPATWTTTIRPKSIPTRFPCRESPPPARISTAAQISASGNDWTTDFQAIQCYDQLKVNAVVNWINGKKHLGDRKRSCPGDLRDELPGGQRWAEADREWSQGRLYRCCRRTPTPSMASEIEFVDAAIGQMVAALENQHLLDSTTIIITAKHGQSPIDTNRFFPIPGNSGTNGNPPSGSIWPTLLPAVRDYRTRAGRG